MNRMHEKPCYLYKVTHQSSGRSYIGISVDPRNRWTHHRNQANSGRDDTYFHRALHKYGQDNFDWKIVCKYVSTKVAKQAERYAISKGYGHYNMTAGGDGVEGRVWTEESRQKISESHKARGPRGPMSDYQKAAIKAGKEGTTPWNKGLPMSEQAKSKASAALQGKVRTEEFKAAVSAFMTGRKKTPEQIEKVAACHRGKKKSPEEIAKRTETRRANAVARGKPY